MSKEYDEYLSKHVGAVLNAANWMLRNLNVFDGMTDEEARAFRNAVSNHDRSKYSSEEYGPYDAYFYGEKDEEGYFYGEKDEEAFNRAWLHHIHNNPHHWQHWLLMNDDGKYRDPDKVVALEMPRVYALEMVADWWSFSWRSGNLEEVFGWYEGHKDNIILHPKTREFVEAVLGEIWGRLPARVSE